MRRWWALNQSITFRDCYADVQVQRCGRTVAVDENNICSIQRVSCRYGLESSLALSTGLLSPRGTNWESARDICIASKLRGLYLRLSRLFIHREGGKKNTTEYKACCRYLVRRVQLAQFPARARRACTKPGRSAAAPGVPTHIGSAPVSGHPNRAGYPIRPRLEYFCLVGVLFTHCCHQHVLLLASFFWNNNRTHLSAECRTRVGRRRNQPSRACRPQLGPIRDPAEQREHNMAPKSLASGTMLRFPLATHWLTVVVNE
jgi:hypothetical protein